LPGYPHYSPKDDILANEERIDADVEALSVKKKYKTISK